MRVNPNNSLAGRSLAEPQRFESDEGYTPDESDLEAMTLVKSVYDPQSSERAHLERRWTLNRAYKEGLQWQTWDSRKWGLVNSPPSGRQRVREIRNFIRPIVERMVAVLTDIQPEFKVRPRNSDEENEQASRTGEKVAEYYWDHLRMEDVFQRVAYDMAVYGTGFLKVQWDPSLGDAFEGPDVDLETQQPIPDTLRLYHEGDIKATAASPFTIHVDPLATCEDDVESVLQVTRRPLAWIDRYDPEKALYIRGGLDDEASVGRRQAGLAQLGVDSEGATATADNWCTVYELYSKPTAKYPRGRFVLIVNDVVVRNTDNPMPKGCLPIIAFRKNLINDSFWGSTEIDDLITPQLNYNRLVSKRLEHNFMMGMNAKVLVPAVAGITQGQFVSGVGEMIKYNGAQPPQYMVPPPLPSESDTEMQRVHSDVDLITSTYGPERGQYQGKMSGTAINLLVEQSMKSKVPVMKRIQGGLQQWGRLILMLAQKHVTTTKVMAIQGKHRKFDIQSFVGADLAGNTDLIIETRSVMPKSRQVHLEQLALQAQIGLFNPASPRHTRQAWKQLEIEDPDTFVEDENMHRAVAQQENKLLIQGIQIPPPNPWEDFEIHMEELVRLMNSDEWKELEPLARVPTLQHYQETAQLAFPQPGVMLPQDQQQALARPEPQPEKEPAS